MNELAKRETTTVGAFDSTDEKVLQYLGLNPQDPKSRAVVAVARYYDLDPLLKHVVIVTSKKTGKSDVYITRDGYLHVAHSSRQLDGIVVEQEPTLSEDGKEWVARVSVWRKDMSHPFTYPGRYPVEGFNREYAQEMAMKAAEAHALRRAFNVAGLPAEDEQRPAAQQRPGGRVTAAEVIGAASAEPEADEAVDGEVVDDDQAEENPLHYTDADLRDGSDES